MNNVYVSGIVKGAAVKFPVKTKDGESKPDGVMRIIVTVDNKQNPREYKLFSPGGENGDKLAAVPSGKRIVLAGRLGSEEIEGVYQGGISLVKTIAVTESMNGIDYAYGVVGGNATCEQLRYTQSGSAIANLNIKNTRTFTSKKEGGKEYTSTTFLNAVAWTEKAQQIAPYIPMTDFPIVVSGILVPSEYESTKNPGVKVSKVEVWVDEFSVPTASVPDITAAVAPTPRPTRKTKGSDDTEF